MPQSGSLHRRTDRLAHPVGSGLTQGSLFTYLGELQSRGLLQLSLARNQHERTHIQISEPFWPYRRSLVQEPEAAESQYLDQVARLLLEAPGVQCSFSPRPIGSWPLNGHTGGPITSLNYFEPLIQEVRQQPVSDQYWDYLKSRLRTLRQTMEATICRGKLCFSNPHRKGEMR